MQADMHYYGTYALALAAGLKGEVACEIATAAQYVDDSDDLELLFDDGSFFYGHATGHHPVNKRNLDGHDQRHVWIPFHFLPGNQGATLHEKLVCRTDSQIAREMLAWAVEESANGHGPMLLGIAAHAYADTFAHYGFSGIAADINRVDFDSIRHQTHDPRMREYVDGKAKGFFDTLRNYIQNKPAAEVANAVGLGHGGVATFPDRPYMRWSFNYEDGRVSGARDNPATFMLACEKLHAAFQTFANKRPDLRADAGQPFAGIQPLVRDILTLEADMDGRARAWRQACGNGNLLGRAAHLETYDHQDFARQLERGDDLHKTDAMALGAVRFLRAANRYRKFVLEDLLPRHEVHVFAG